MSLKIIHISDVHIRNLKYHADYRRVFEALYKEIERLKPDVVINTGDLAHTKTQISPEYVEMASEHLRRVSQLVPYHLIPGNHDMNLMNLERQDAVTPIIDSIKSKDIFFHKKSGLAHTIEKDGQKYNLWVFSLADTENYPIPSEWAHRTSEVNIGLFHGSVSTCVTDMNWRMTSVEHDLSIFDGLDFALLGDIHKQQFFRGRTIAYAGSLIQQNFGEELNKGFLFWELNKKGEQHKVSSVFLQGSKPFYTIRLNEDLSVPEMNIQESAHVRISPPRNLTLVEQKDAEQKVKQKYKPSDVITLSAGNIGSQKVSVGKKFSDVENLRDVHVQEKLIKEFLKDEKIDSRVIDKIMDMNRRYQIHIDQKDDGARNVKWKIEKLGWNNLFNYGKGNIIDFSRLGGLTGIFAPNGSGKSNFIDIILETCFDATTKGINKNIFLINDNKEVATAIAEIVANDQTYEITRNIERIKHNQKGNVKQWGKTSVTFSMVDSDGQRESLVGDLRPETESKIRQRLGTFDDFMLTSLMAQWNPMDIISAKETKRKEIIYRFLDLDVFGQKAIMAKDESRDYVRKLAELNDDELEDELRDNQERLATLEEDISNKKALLSVELESINSLRESIKVLNSKRTTVEKITEENWEKQIRSVDDDKESESRVLTEKLTELTRYEKELAALTVFPGIDVESSKKSRTRLVEILKKIASTEVMVGERQTELTSAQQDAALLKEVPCGSKFPSCQLLQNAFECERKIDSLSARLESTKSALAQLISEKDTLLPIVARLDEFEKMEIKRSSLESKCANLKLQIENSTLKVQQHSTRKSEIEARKSRFEEMKLKNKKNEKLDEQVKAKEKLISDAEQLRESLNSQIQQKSVDLGSIKSSVAELDGRIAEIENLKSICQAYEHYVHAMGKDGIPYEILTQKLPLINEEINKILSNVADFGIFLEHDNEEQSIKFYLQYGQWKSRLLDLGSGAEKFLASIAIRNALLNISTLPKTNMLIIDEGFGKLDPKNLEAIQLMFDYLKTVFDHVFVISHLETMKDLVDNIIEISNDEEGYAHMEVGT